MLLPIVSQAAMGHFAWTTIALPVVAAPASAVAADFFAHLLLYPGQHMYAIIAFGVFLGGAILGTLFLAKKAYDKKVEASRPSIGNASST